MFQKYTFILATILGYFLFMQSGFAADPGLIFGVEKITDNLQNGGSDLVSTTDNILGYILGLIYFISIIVAIYGGFLILTSGGDEDKVKKGKNLIIYMVLGIVVIFLASQLVTWIIGLMGSEDIVGPTS